MRSHNWKWLLSFLLLIAGITLGLLVATSFHITSPSKGLSQTRINASSPKATPLRSRHDFFALENISRAFTKIAKRVIPTVVSIHCTKILTEDELSGFSYQKEKGNGHEDRPYKFRVPRQYRQEGSGSGVLISPDGFIVTNFHVVNHAQKIKVVLSDNRSFPAKIIGSDRLSEIAVIKIEAENLPYAKLGDSDSSEVGQWVLAIGNPLDLNSTVTAGIISAKGRQIDIINDNFAVESFIQTDAAINPGNSGGALVNLHGEVIGINTAIATETGYDMGFGFAIPINLAKKISADLIRNGRVVRGYLGIAMQNIEEIQAKALHLDRPKGIFVDDVFKNSPAEKSDIQPMDVILAVNGEPVNRTNHLQAWVAKKNPGTEISLKLLRQGRIIYRKVVLGAREDQNSVVRRSSFLPRKFKNLGIQIQKLTEFDGIELGYQGGEGVLITKIQRHSPADKSGLQVDDIIVKVNRRLIQTVKDFYAEMQNLKSGDVAIFKVFRASGNFHYFIEVP